jgi:hypothetical protein
MRQLIVEADLSSREDSSRCDSAGEGKGVNGTLCRENAGAIKINMASSTANVTAQIDPGPTKRRSGPVALFGRAESDSAVAAKGMYARRGQSHAREDAQPFHERRPQLYRVTNLFNRFFGQLRPWCTVFLLKKALFIGVEEETNCMVPLVSRLFFGQREGALRAAAIIAGSGFAIGGTS